MWTLAPRSIKLHFVFTCSSHEDETAALCHWHIQKPTSLKPGAMPVHTKWHGFYYPTTYRSFVCRKIPFCEMVTALLGQSTSGYDTVHQILGKVN
jgi:hypothetical protein